MQQASSPIITQACQNVGRAMFAQGGHSRYSAAEKRHALGMSSNDTLRTMGSVCTLAVCRSQHHHITEWETLCEWTIGKLLMLACGLRPTTPLANAGVELCSWQTVLCERHACRRAAACQKHCNALGMRGIQLRHLRSSMQAQIDWCRTSGWRSVDVEHCCSLPGGAFLRLQYDGALTYSSSLGALRLSVSNAVGRRVLMLAKSWSFRDYHARTPTRT